MPHAESAVSDADIDRYESRVQSYLHGGCHLVALALNEMFDLQLRGLWDDHATDVAEGHMGLVHFFAVLPDGRAVDAKGIRTEEQVAQDFGFSVHDLVTQDHSSDDVRNHQPVIAADIALAKGFVGEGLEREVRSASGLPLGFLR